MSKKTKYKNNIPREEPGLHRTLVTDIITKEEIKEKVKISYFKKAKNDGLLHLIGIIIIFTIIVLSLSFQQISIDKKTPITIKLKTVDNYSNYIIDECGSFYQPTNPSLAEAHAISDKEYGKYTTTMILNTSDVYDAVIISSPLLRSAYRAQITQFKLIDPSKYIKNC